MNHKVPAEVFPPGDFLKEELEARGWTQTDLAAILGRPPRVVNEIIAGKRAVTPETAQGLADAFGTSAELWMNLETSYRLWKLARKGERDLAVSRRAHLYSCFPIKEMLRREWIESSDNIDVLETRVLESFRLKTINDPPQQLAVAARKSTPYNECKFTEWAWYLRAWRMGQCVQSAPFTHANFRAGWPQLLALRENAEDVRRVPEFLALMGVRLVIVEHMPHTRLDGACLWLDKAKKQPVIALSLRYDRIDYFWFTLLHELVHVEKGDDTIIEADLVGEDAIPQDEKPPAERAADEAASGALIPEDQMLNFMNRTRPFYSQLKVRGFAARLHVHPGIVVGQLHRRKEIPYSNLRGLLAPVRAMLFESALTDGWGRKISLPN